MKELNLSIISNVSIIDLGNGFSKAIYTFNFPENLPMGYFMQKKVISTIIGMVVYLNGYFGIALKENNLLLSEVEVIIPPIAEYMNLENKLKHIILNHSPGNSKVKKFSVSKGVTISIPSTDGKKFDKDKISKYLKKFKVNSNNN